MKTSIYHLVLSAVLLAGAVVAATAQETVSLDVPRTISYQGLLTSGDGTPLPNGVYDITVTLFADETGSQEIWQNTYSTSVLNGLFNLHLGAGDAPLPDPVQMNRPLWVGTSVNGTGQMTPLTPLTSSPYALNLPDKAVTTNKLADGAVTAEKVEMDYISEVQIDGQKISAKGTVLNLVSTPNVPLNYDEATQSVTIGQLPAQTGDEEKGADVLATPDAWNSQGDLTNGVVQIPTVAGDWLGTTNNAANGRFDLLMQVRATPIMRYHTGAAGTDPNVEGGQGSAVAAASVGSTIAGGGANAITGDYDAVGGGQTNTIGAAGAAFNYSTIGGGQTNTVDGNFSTVDGGQNNTILGDWNAIGGGFFNAIGGAGLFATYGTIGGGQNNTITTGFTGTIGGGWMNMVTAPEATIAGGHNNRVDSYVGAITGGHDNLVSITSEAGAIGGGRNNTVNARLGTIPGGDYLLTNASYAQSAMGFANAPRGAVGFRPAPAARTDDPLFMIGNGDLSGLLPPPAGARSNAFEVSYNGHSVVYDENGSGGAGVTGPRGAIDGGTYTDNVIYAWAEVDAAGNVVCDDFGVASVVRNGAGVYRVTLNVVAADGVTPRTINCGAAVATLGTGVPGTVAPTTPPAGLQCAYIWTTEIRANVFDVFITLRGAGANCATGTDRPFKFHVTGRPN